MDLPFVSACLKLWGLRAALSCPSWTVRPPTEVFNCTAQCVCRHDVCMYMWNVKDRLVKACEQKGRSMFQCCCVFETVFYTLHGFNQGCCLKDDSAYFQPEPFIASVLAVMNIGYVQKVGSTVTVYVPVVLLTSPCQQKYHPRNYHTWFATWYFVTLVQITFYSQKKKAIYEDNNAVIVVYTLYVEMQQVMTDSQRWQEVGCCCWQSWEALVFNVCE